MESSMCVLARVHQRKQIARMKYTLHRGPIRLVYIRARPFNHSCLHVREADIPVAAQSLRPSLLLKAGEFLRAKEVG